MATSGFNLNWHPERFLKNLGNHLEQNLDAAAIHLENVMKQRMHQGNADGHTPSKPWQPPAIVTGHLKRSISHDRPEPFVRRVGTGIGKSSGEGGKVGYAIWLEFGTRKMLPRPWLRPPLYTERAMIQKLIGQKMPEYA